MLGDEPLRVVRGGGYLLEGALAVKTGDPAEGRRSREVAGAEFEQLLQDVELAWAA